MGEMAQKKEIFTRGAKPFFLGAMEKQSNQNRKRSNRGEQF